MDISDNVYQQLIENINLLAPAPVTAPLSKQGLLVFALEGGSYIPVTAALRENYAGLIGRDLKVLAESGFTITLRFEWPGYSSLDYQLRTLDWRAQPQKITLSKLATEVCKAALRFIEKIQGQTIDPRYRTWRVGPNGIQIQHLYLAALEQVSAGTWQPRLFYKP